MTTPQNVVDGEADAGTRERLIATISEKGPITAGELAADFELTSAAVRRHLIALSQDGLIQEFEPVSAKRRRGRPSKSYVLTGKAHASLTSGYDSLAQMALDELAALGGKEAVINLARKRVANWEEEFNVQLEKFEAEHGESSVADRIELVSRVLSGQGYAVSVRPLAVNLGKKISGNRKDSRGGVRRPRTIETAQFCQGHCPVQDAAANHPELCDMETEAISRMVGVPIQRLATLARGGHACTTHIPLTDGRKP